MRSAAAATIALAAALAAAAALADHHEPPAAAAGFDWVAVADVEEIEVITRDADGELRETTIWLVVVDGQGYIRTGATSWFENVLRDPDVLLRIEDAEWPVRADLVLEDDPVWARVQQAFRDKYGFMDAAVGMLPGAGTRILRVELRAGRAAALP